MTDPGGVVWLVILAHARIHFHDRTRLGLAAPELYSFV
jgi:hypothetical protein